MLRFPKMLSLLAYRLEYWKRYCNW